MSRRALAWARGLAILALAGVAFTVVIKKMDEDNRFCVSCHLHEQHMADMFAVHPAVLAGAHGHAKHAGHPERCFTCHSGEGVTGWTQVTLLSAWDAVRWVAGTRSEPAHMKLPIVDAACLKCHASEVHGTATAEETDQFHQLGDHRSLTVRCVECHVVHRPGRIDRHWLDPAVVQRQCARCHRDLGGSDGPGALRLAPWPGHAPRRAPGVSTPARRLG